MTAANSMSDRVVGDTSPGTVTLTLPPLASMIRVGRLTASSIASLTDMTVDDIDDLKIAISEMITLLIRSGDHDDVTLRFDVDGGALAVEASTPASGVDLQQHEVALATAVLEAVSDSFDVSFVDGQVVIRVVKRALSSAQE
jgi:methyl coenzyme M reductase beta subunit